MRFHVLGMPHTPTSRMYSTDAFAQKTYSFCKMMTSRGHTVYHYGIDGSDAICTENISVVTQEMFLSSPYGRKAPHAPNILNADDSYSEVFVNNAIAEIGKRKQPNDFLLPFWGVSMIKICDAHPDLITVEPGIGYPGAFARYRVYESYAWMSCHLGENMYPDWYHVVIPAFFDISEFTFNGSINDRLETPYFLFTGRVCNIKGVHIAMQVCKELGVKLVVVGSPFEEYVDFEWPPYVEYVGPLGVEDRNKLMAHAVALFVPSLYSEPFGCVQVESFLCGTPVISTDWGAFSEVNIQGVTGYRCRTFNDFLNAAMDCLEGKIDPADCRKVGEQYSFETIAPRYEKYFQDVLSIHTGNGWYELSDKTKNRIDSMC